MNMHDRINLVLSRKIVLIWSWFHRRHDAFGPPSLLSNRNIAHMMTQKLQMLQEMKIVLY